MKLRLRRQTISTQRSEVIRPFSLGCMQLRLKSQMTQRKKVVLALLVSIQLTLWNQAIKTQRSEVIL